MSCVQEDREDMRAGLRLTVEIMEQQALQELLVRNRLRI